MARVATWNGQTPWGNRQSPVASPGLRDLSEPLMCYVHCNSPRGAALAAFPKLVPNILATVSSQDYLKERAGWVCKGCAQKEEKQEQVPGRTAAFKEEGSRSRPTLPGNTCWSVCSSA